MSLGLLCQPFLTQECLPMMGLLTLILACAPRIRSSFLVFDVNAKEGKVTK